MSFFYADTSAIVRAYFADEPDHKDLRKQILDSKDLVVSSELARPEFASAVYAAHRAGRLLDPKVVLSRFDADCGPEGPLTLLAFEPSVVFPACLGLLSKHPLRTLDALHLAVVVDVRVSVEEDLFLISRDQNQAAAARAEGIRLA